MFLGQEQAFCFLIAQHELIEASQEQAGGKLISRLTVIDETIGKGIVAECALTERQQKILLCGGLLNYTREGGQ